MRGSAALLHAAPWPDPLVPEVRFCDFAGPALVLGSSQPEAQVDRDAVRRAGWQLVRRRSGGGAVAMIPGQLVWLDVFVPRGHQRWRDDVAEAFGWLGEVWAEALHGLGYLTEVLPAGFHDGGVPSVCFAGRGAGEVVMGDGAKLVGLSQRRRRDGARFQCAAMVLWDRSPYDRFLGPPHRLPRGEAEVAAGIGVPPAAVEAAFLTALGGGG